MGCAWSVSEKGATQQDTAENGLGIVGDVALCATGISISIVDSEMEVILSRETRAVSFSSGDCG